MWSGSDCSWGWWRLGPREEACMGTWLASWEIRICCQELVMWQVKDWKQRECDRERDGRCVPWWVESLCDLEVSWFLMRDIVVLTSSKQLASLISPRITNKVCYFPVFEGYSYKNKKDTIFLVYSDGMVVLIQKFHSFLTDKWCQGVSFNINTEFSVILNL